MYIRGNVLRPSRSTNTTAVTCKIIRDDILETPQSRSIREDTLETSQSRSIRDDILETPQ